MDANERARAREEARNASMTARRLAEASDPSEDGGIARPAWAVAVEGLCDAIDRLADVSEAQESES